MNEAWKPVVGSAGYEVSSLGQVRRVVTGRVLKPGLGSHGYLAVSMGRRNHHLVHRLVAAAFLQPVPGKAFVNHINGVKTDNRADNVEWTTRSLNQLHAMRIGTYAGPPLKQGAAQVMSKLTDDKVRQIRAQRAAGDYCRVIAERFGVTQTAVSYVCGRGWKHVT